MKHNPHEHSEKQKPFHIHKWLDIVYNGKIIYPIAENVQFIKWIKLASFYEMVIYKHKYIYMHVYGCVTLCVCTCILLSLTWKVKGNEQLCSWLSSGNIGVYNHLWKEFDAPFVPSFKQYAHQQQEHFALVMKYKGNNGRNIFLKKSKLSLPTN